MTRKDYIRIANAIATAAAAYPVGVPARAVAIRALSDCALHIAYQLQQDNPRFDRDRFIAACGV